MKLTFLEMDTDRSKPSKSLFILTNEPTINTALWVVSFKLTCLGDDYVVKSRKKPRK